MTTCNGCGGCCDPVTIGYSQNEAEALWLDGRITAEQYHWVTEVLEPMRPKEAKRIAPWLFEGQFRKSIDPDGGVLTFFYRCSWFDRDTRECTHYDERPDVCQKYPFGYGMSNEMAVRAGLPPALPPMCSFNADIGRDPEPVPVTMLPTRNRT